jgi:uncharacterized protein YndB with AHSA1/START domain
MKVSMTTAHDRHTLRIERRFAHPAAKVWEAMTGPEHLSAWWPTKTDRVELAIGATIEFVDEEGSTYLGEVIELDPGRVLAFREDGADEVRWELAADGDGTIVVFTHTFDQGPPPAQHATGWHVCFDALDALLDGRPLPPHVHDEALERHYDDVLRDVGSTS